MPDSSLRVTTKDLPKILRIVIGIVVIVFTLLLLYSIINNITLGGYIGLIFCIVGASVIAMRMNKTCTTTL